MSGDLVHTWRKNSREEVRATLQTFKDYRLADVRVYVVAENEEPKPTRKGIAVRVVDLPKLKQSVDALVAAVEAEAAAEAKAA